MTELTSTRIKTHATKLGLPHLAASLEQLLARADSEQLDTSISSTWSSKKSSASAMDAASGKRYACRSCRTTRPSTSSTTRSNPTSTSGRSKT